jgi:glycosyltransferase involved in cell wall biosynthesis
VNIGIVAPYPPPNSTHSKQSGIASYTKNLAKAMSEHGNHVSVFGNILDGIDPKYEENGIKVNRCWDGGLKSWLQIARMLWGARKRLDIVHIQFTFSLYGGIASSFMFPILLLLLRVIRIPTVITMHEVVPLTGLDKKFLEETGIKGNLFILKTGIYRLVKLIVSLTNGTIVHDPFFSKVIVNQYKCKNEKIQVVPHGIEESNNLLDQKKARETLGIKQKHVLLFFGYIAKYKGLDILLDAIKKLDEDYILLVAGGEHPRLKGKREYNEYLTTLLEKAAGCRASVVFTGFVNETDITLYFSAADLLILPYTTLMSSSGPLSLCVAYKKPFLASESLADIIPEPEILFPNTADGFKDKIQQFFLHQKIAQKSLEYGEKLLQRGLWSKVANDNLLVYEGLSSSGAPAAFPALYEPIPGYMGLKVGVSYMRTDQNINEG